MATEQDVDEAYDDYMTAREKWYKAQDKTNKARDKEALAEVALSRAYQRWQDSKASEGSG